MTAKTAGRQVKYGSIEHCRIIGHEVNLWGRCQRISDWESLCGGWWECKTCGNEEMARSRVKYG